MDYHLLLESAVMLILSYCFLYSGFTQFLGSIHLYYQSSAWDPLCLPVRTRFSVQIAFSHLVCRTGIYWLWISYTVMLYRHRALNSSSMGTSYNSSKEYWGITSPVCGDLLRTVLLSQYHIPFFFFFLLLNQLLLIANSSYSLFQVFSRRLLSRVLHLQSSAIQSLEIHSWDLPRFVYPLCSDHPVD